MKPKILIDNGHGVSTRGKRSPDGRLLEYKWTRTLAARLYAMLRAEGLDAELLVPEDADISIGQRCMRANAICDRYGRRNVLLVSIHVNANGNGTDWDKASGFSVFVSKNASDASHRLAAAFTDLAIRAGLTGNRSIPPQKYWTWNWTKADIGILSGTKCPAVLTENLFMTNRDDTAFLLSESGMQAIADLHLRAVMAYLGK